MTQPLKADVYINTWQVGLYDQRSPIFLPLSTMGIQIAHRADALWDGQNVDISHEMTLVRRAGFPRYCSAQLGASERPLAFYSFKDVNGTIKAMVDLPTRVAWFDGTSITNVFTKTSTAQGSFLKVGSTLYFCDGNDADLKKWANGVVSKWGIAAPVTAPTITIVSGALSPLRGYKYVYAYKNSSTGHVSTASPASASTAVQSNKNFTIAGTGSTDPQVDKIDIYRTNDDETEPYYLVATINNTPAWSYTDSTQDDDLNTMIVAPTENLNDPPPSGASLAAFYAGRIWLAADNKLYCSAGGAVTNGVPAEAFPPANVFTFPGKITALAPTSAGLAVFTEADAFVVLGADLISFTPKIWQRNFGVKTQNCVVQDGDLIFLFTSNRQLFMFSGGQIDEKGFPIQARLGAFDPAKVSLAIHRNGADEGLFISNGVDTVYRYSVAMGCWSTPYAVAGGVGTISSIEVAAGDYRLMAGRAAGNGYLLNRDTTSFLDDGAAYGAWAVVGSLVVAPPRQVALVNSITVESKPVGKYPNIAVRLNEISGNFTTLPNPVPDPPQLALSTTIKMMRHDLKAAQTPLPQWARHVYIRFDWAAENAKSELLSIGVV